MCVCQYSPMYRWCAANLAEVYKPQERERRAAKERRNAEMRLMRQEQA
jgi:hypothetical protein